MMDKEMIWSPIKPIKTEWDDLDESKTTMSFADSIRSISCDESLPTGLSYSIKTETEVLKERVDTLIRAITNLIKDKENLEKQVAHLTDKVYRNESEEIIIKTDMATMASTLEAMQKDYEKFEDRTIKIEAKIMEKLDKA